MSASNPVFIDSMEPNSIEVLLRQSLTLERYALNAQGFADYYWTAHDDHAIQVARETTTAILSNTDGVENELSKSLGTMDIGKDELILLVEGWPKSSPFGVDVYSTGTKGGQDYVRKVWSYGDTLRPRSGAYAKLHGWLWQVYENGIAVIFTCDLTDSARIIALIYNASQNPEHQTLRRYLKPIKQPWTPNIHVANLLSLRMEGNKPTRLGRTDAEKLIDVFGSFYAVVTGDEAVIAEITGPKVANNIIRAVGRVG